MTPMRVSGSRSPAARRQAGIALVLTLWLTVLLTAIAGGFAYSMRTEALAAGNAIGVAKARAAADGAVERTAFELTRPRLPGSWLPNGAPHWTHLTAVSGFIVPQLAQVTWPAGPA